MSNNSVENIVSIALSSERKRVMKVFPVENCHN